MALLPETGVLLEAFGPEGPANSSTADPPAHRDPEREAVELFGMALWDIFSNGNSVVDAEGRAHDLGSFRASAHFIAEIVEERYPEIGDFDYIHFYMGTTPVPDGVDLRPLYRWIFQLLREAGRDWRYVFPRLHVVRMPETEDDDFESYDPSVAVATQLERTRRNEEFRRLQEDLDLAYRESMERARHGPPPATVTAYRDVFGAFPDGWPPEND